MENSNLKQDDGINSNKTIKSEFKYDFKNEDADDDYERVLEKDIEANCDFGEYVDKLEIEEKSDEELLKMEKYEIIDFKNYQIQKLKAYINSLEKEKEDLIENFKNTTNVLIEKLKNKEENETGFRPSTPHLLNIKNREISNSNSGKINNNKNNNLNSLSTTNESVNININLRSNFFEESKDDEPGRKRCPNCTKIFAENDYVAHSLECLRNKIKCKKCGELISEKNKKDHILEWRDTNVSLII